MAVTHTRVKKVARPGPVLLLLLPAAAAACSASAGASRSPPKSRPSRAGCSRGGAGLGRERGEAFSLFSLLNSGFFRKKKYKKYKSCEKQQTYQPGRRRRRQKQSASTRRAHSARVFVVCTLVVCRPRRCAATKGVQKCSGAPPYAPWRGAPRVDARAAASLRRFLYVVVRARGERVKDNDFRKEKRTVFFLLGGRRAKRKKMQSAQAKGGGGAYVSVVGKCLW